MTLQHNEHKQVIALLNKNNGVMCRPQACRAYISDMVAALHYPEYTELHSIWHPLAGMITPHVKNDINLNNISLAIWTKAANRDKHADKFASFMLEVESSLEVETSEITCPEFPEDANTAPFIVKASSFWCKSPVLLNALTLFMRLAVRMRKNEKVDDFFARLLNKEDCSYKEAMWFRKAYEAGNIMGLLHKNLPCMNRDGFSDFLLHEHNRGIAYYYAPSDGVLPSDEKRLKLLRVEGMKVQLERLKEHEALAT